MVTLAEDLFLLVCDEESGRPRISITHLDFGLGGALLLDLNLAERVALVDDLVAVVNRASIGDPLLDLALATVAARDSEHEPEYWVRHLAKGAREAVQRRLVAAGVLEVEDRHVLGVIRVHRTHQVDGRLEHELVDRLRNAVVLDRPASRETAALVSLALGVGLERHLFPRSDLRAVQRRMEEIAGDDWVGPAVRHTIMAADAALGF
jgi:Golgi phosphoprotein 3 (GPP34)